MCYVLHVYISTQANNVSDLMMINSTSSVDPSFPMSLFQSRNSCKTLKCPKCNWHYKYRYVRIGYTYLSLFILSTLPAKRPLTTRCRIIAISSFCCDWFYRVFTKIVKSCANYRKELKYNFIEVILYMFKRLSWLRIR